MNETSVYFCLDNVVLVPSHAHTDQENLWKLLRVMDDRTVYTYATALHNNKKISILMQGKPKWEVGRYFKTNFHICKGTPQRHHQIKHLSVELKRQKRKTRTSKATRIMLYFGELTTSTTRTEISHKGNSRSSTSPAASTTLNNYTLLFVVFILHYIFFVSCHLHYHSLISFHSKQ